MWNEQYNVWCLQYDNLSFEKNFKKSVYPNFKHVSNNSGYGDLINLRTVADQIGLI